MKTKTITRQLNYQPTKLQKNQIDHPFEVMNFFFLDFSIQETRSNLWELYKAWIHHSSQYADEQLSKDMLCFYTQFSEFIDACFLYTKREAK